MTDCGSRRRLYGAAQGAEAPASQAPERARDHCVTCSDEAVALRVDAVRPDGTALCEGVEVMTDLVGSVEPGDVVIVHAGVALQLAQPSPEVAR
jgi:hypothetical protein